LRHIVEKLEPSMGAADEHDLHTRGVLLAGRRSDGAKFLQKALDRHHRVADRPLRQGEGRRRRAGAVGRGAAPGRHLGRLLGGADPSGDDRGGDQARLRGRAHALAPGRRRQSRRHPPAASARSRQCGACGEARTPAVPTARGLWGARGDHSAAGGPAGAPGRRATPRRASA
jgi:hypothetical protein